WAHHTMMKKGMWSPAAHKAWVMKVQHALDMHGAHLKVDGNWGPMTKKALVAFQQSHGLAASGHMDKATLAKLGLAHHHAMMKPAKH
ncbi:Peptidoglycan binding-like domain protein, partial [mine drainage metagenome]